MNATVLAVLIIGLEGLASFVLLSRDMIKTTRMTRPRPVQYDSLLGWVNKPNLELPDLYGPSAGLRTNAQGFRNDHDIQAAVPAAKFRVLCSGDSFTLGFGVDDDHAWCQVLSQLDPRIEAVNLGQEGYGVDQAYLRYRRDGAAFASHLHLLAFITADFDRMQWLKFLEYGKPRLILDHDSLVATNVPVPARASYASWLADNTGNLNGMRLVQLATRVVGKVRDVRAADTTAPPADSGTRAVARAIFADLTRHHRSRGGTLVLVYLPTLSDLRGKPPLAWMNFVEGAARELGIPFIDVVTALRERPDEEPEDLFITYDAIAHPGLGGHYNVRGNQVVAEMIHSEVQRLLAEATALGRGGAGPAPPGRPQDSPRAPGGAAPRR